MFRKEKEPTDLDQALVRAFSNLKSHTVDSDEYAEVLERIQKLHKMKMEEDPSNDVSKDVLVQTGANLLGILMIISYEQAHVVSSRAMGFIRPR